MRIRRQAFTLLELILSLALTVAVVALIGGLVQMFLINQERGQDNVRQAQLARAILNMITEDIRTTVRYQPFDTSGLEQMLSGDPAAGGAASATASGGEGGASGGGSGGASSPGATGQANGGTAPTSGSAADENSSENAPLPPGLYGSETSLEIDISRLPRPDEYFPQMADPTTGNMGDMPSDIKTVGYYVQAPGPTGIQDPLATLMQQSAAAGSSVANGQPSNGGLVRRSVDRAVTQFAYESAQSDGLLKTGQIVAPEVIAIEFSYFDGETWQSQWDGSQQGLPRVVKVTIALQRESFMNSKPMTQGAAMSTLTSDVMQEYGIDVYSVNTIIPGSQLLVAPQGMSQSGSSDNGMGAMGL